MAQMLRSPTVGALQRSTQPTYAIQTPKLLSIRAAPQNITPFVSSSSPIQTARPLSRPLRSAPDHKPLSTSPSSQAESLRSFWAEIMREALWSMFPKVLGFVLLVLFCNLYPNPMPDRIYVPHVFAAFLWLELADLPEGRWSWSYAVSVTVVTAMIATAFVRA